MGTALVTVHLFGYGQAWDNTWALNVVGEEGNPLSDRDVGDIADNALPYLATSAGTNVNDAGFGGATSPIASILGFHRAIQPAAVSITGVLVNDGATPGAGTGPFWSQALALPCLAETPTAASVAPLSIALLVNRSTADIGVKPGRLYLRAVLQDTEVYPGSRVGVTWTDAAAQVAATTRMNDSVDAALLVNWTVLASPDPAWYISIPHYGKVPGVDEGQVIGGSPLNSISVNKPVSRQMTRGRRRPAPVGP